jgi:hypothetical protein
MNLLTDRLSTWRDGKKELRRMENLFSRDMNRGQGPSRLFVGGVHGKEGKSTIRALKSFNEGSLKKGKLFLCNFPESPYISTLVREYYDSPRGLELLRLIKKINPKIYLELHCYHEESYFKLTREDRKKESGVPSLVELDKGILMGSISPIIRSVLFKQQDFPFILEMPCNPGYGALQVYLEVLNIVAGSDDRFEILKKLEPKYPQQVEKLQRYFVDFSDNFWILFQKTSENARRNNLTNLEDLKNFMNNLIKELDLNLNPIQIDQVAEAVLIFLKT